MPELPEVEALCRFLDSQCAGSQIDRVEVAALAALKTFEPPINSVVGRTVASVSRKAKYLFLDLDGLWMVVHLSRGGWVQWRESVPPGRARPGRGPLALRVGLRSGSGFDLTEQGTEKRLAVWLVESPESIGRIADLGPDPLDPSFSEEDLAGALGGAGGTLKTALTDQSAISGIGNAYSDEILHAARMSPYKPAAKLNGGEIGVLHRAIVGVLHAALGRSLGLPAKDLKGEKREGMAVHGRAGLPCPVCGDDVREVSYASRSMQYCPTCQTGGKPLADRRLSRLVK